MDLVTQLCSLMGVLALVQNLIPPQLRHLIDGWFEDWWDWLCKASNRYTYLEVHENGHGGEFMVNLLYREVELYLGSLEKIHDTHCVNVNRFDDTRHLTFSLPANETIEDSYQGAQLWWTHHSVQKKKRDSPQGWWSYSSRRESGREEKSFSLKMFKRDRARLLSHYFGHISKVAMEIERLNTQRKLFTNSCEEWEEVAFSHPSSFETLALEPELKDRIKADLKAFSQGEDFYHSIGRAWKRGYLLYGPPGTGKSSMIAAMANFLHYDVYDLELTSVSKNSELKSLLIQTTKKSIIVIEDIDCSLDLSDRSSKASGKGSKKEEVEGKPSRRVTLSGLLNFTDGLWSCCGEERIFIFTTNHKDRLDPALLRSGRMDFHILLSYCTFAAFKVLASNYLGIQDHELYAQLEEAMKSMPKVTPAEIAELLIGNKGSPDAALKSVIDALDKAREKAMGDEGQARKGSSKGFQRLRFLVRHGSDRWMR